MVAMAEPGNHESPNHASPLAEPQPHVIVLLCVYHPHEGYLRQQLDSILAQTHQNLSIWVSDDGNDGDDQGTRALLAEYQARLPAGQLTIVQGPQQGYAANFLSLVNRDEIDADYYAFCDQDDLWEPNKLEHVIGKLAAVVAEPALYGSRTRLIDEQGRAIGFSPLFSRPPSFANALVQNLADSNTMVFNHAAKALICHAGVPNVVSHDWWTYLLVSGAGGTVIYDPTPYIGYRQHEGNLMGANISMRARIVRLRWLFQNRFRDWNDLNVAALEEVRDCLSAENQRVLELFARARESGLLTRCVLLKQVGIYRQTRLGNMGLLLAILTNKL